MTTHSRSVKSLSQAQRDRLSYIDFRLFFMGEIRRIDLARQFGVASAASTRDLTLYREVAPRNIEFDGSSKIYRIGNEFVPIFDHSPQRVLSLLSNGYGQILNEQSSPMLCCDSTALHTCPDIDVLAPICRAIHSKCPLSIGYHSTSRGHLLLEIVPFALVNTGFQWLVRAFDRESNAFRYFATIRIDSPQIMSEAKRSGESSEDDAQWTRFLELDLVPHPRLNNPEIIKKDYGIKNNSIKVRVRAAMAGYVLRRWNVDASPDHSLKDEHYRLCLSNNLVLDQVENAKIAPGYRDINK